MSIASVMLAANDPEDLRNVVYEQGRMIEELQKRFLDLQTLSEITPDFGDGFAAGMSAESLKIRAESVESNWWMPLTVADDDVTLVFALALGKDEDGNKILYAGGRFNRIGGVAAKNIAKYTFVNRQWSALGDGLNDDVAAIAIGAAGDVYAGGKFTNAGGVANADHIAKWNGSAWSALGGGLNGDVFAVAIGAAGDVYAGGAFTNAGGEAYANFIAKWNGSAWSALGGGLNDDVFAVAIGAAGDIYAGGAFTNAGGDANADHIAKWNGSAWSALGDGLNDDVEAIAIGAAGDVYAGGVFTNAGGDANADYIAKWDGSAWSALGDGLNDDGVFAVAIGAAGDVYAGGAFTNAGGDPNATKIAHFDGDWNAISGNVPGINKSVWDNVNIIVIDQDTGSLYIGGSFTSVSTMDCRSLVCFSRPLAETLDLTVNMVENYFSRMKSIVGRVWTTIVKTTTEERSGTTAFQSDLDLIVLVPANKRYLIRGRVFFSSNETADFKYRFGFAFGSGLVETVGYPVGSSTPAQNVSTAFSSDIIGLNGGTGMGYVEFNALVVASSSDANFEFRWAQITSSAQKTSVLAGSYLEWMEV